MRLQFQFVGGSVTGRDHRDGVPRNNQDAFRIEQGRYGTTVVVADGCGSSEHSEVGAKLGVAMMSTYLQRGLDRGYPPGADLLRRVRQSMVSNMQVLSENMGSSLSRVVNDYFLFTLCGVIITDQTALFFALGDGVFVINGEVVIIHPGADEGQGPDSPVPELTNAPVYLGYALTGSSLTDDDPTKLDLRVIRQLPTADLHHFLIGTDGVGEAISRADRCLPGTDELFGPISQFWEDDHYFSSGSAAVTLRLDQMAADVTDLSPRGRLVTRSGQLADDTTLVAGRRIPPTEE